MSIKDYLVRIYMADHLKSSSPASGIHVRFTVRFTRVAKWFESPRKQEVMLGDIVWSLETSLSLLYFPM